MSTKALPKVDKFYLIFAVVMLVIASFVILVLKVIFSSISSSFDIESRVTEGELRIDKDKLNKALGDFEGRKIVPLEIR